MEELIVLGTGNAQATKNYNTCFAIKKNKEYFLVDTGGGNGILGQLEKADIPLERIHHIFITHEHTDHILGVVWLIRMIGAKMNQGKYDGKLMIFCHAELVNTIKTIVTLTVQAKFHRHFGSCMLFVPLTNGEEKEILGNKYIFFDIGSKKAKQFGFTTTLNSGKKVTFAGDEPYSEAIRDYALQSDWLFHEAFCLYGDRDIFKPYEKHHSTVKEACEIATRLEIKNLLLWHTEDKSEPGRTKRYKTEGKKYFTGELYVPKDLERIAL